MRKPKTIVYVQDNETAFLAVDVEVSTTTSLEPLLAALGERVLVYHAERLARGSYQALFAALDRLEADLQPATPKKSLAARN